MALATLRLIPQVAGCRESALPTTDGKRRLMNTPASPLPLSLSSTSAAMTTPSDHQQLNQQQQQQQQQDGGSTRCDCCKSCGAILELEGCGHRFHPRCIYAFPVTHCELCAEPVAALKIFRPFHDTQNTMLRKGKWSPDEHKYANMMMKQFQLGALPLVDGLHLRGFIANLLQCDPLRVTKKYSGHAIGKQNFYYQRNKNYCYNLHTKLQKRISSLRNHFYWHMQYRCKFGYSINIQELKAAEADYWIREFLKFAERIGQPVELAPASSEDAVGAMPLTPDAAPPTPGDAFTPVPPPSTLTVTIAPRLVPQPQPQAMAATIAANAVSTAATQRPIIPEEGSKTPPTPQVACKLDFSSERASSPLGFDEWNEDGNPVMMDFLDNAVLDDFARSSQSQFSAILGEMLTAPTKPTPVLATGAHAQPSSKSTSSVRCSLGEWLKEEESRWNESMTATSWSFSLTLSDCA